MVDGLEQFSIGNHDPNTDELIFFRGVETTNLIYIYICIYGGLCLEQPGMKGIQLRDDNAKFAC